jgi:hypothetical protein
MIELKIKHKAVSDSIKPSSSVRELIELFGRKKKIEYETRISAIVTAIFCF